MFSCHCRLQCYNQLSGVKLSIRSLCFIQHFHRGCVPYDTSLGSLFYDKPKILTFILKDIVPRKSHGFQKTKLFPRGLPAFEHVIR